MRISNHATHAAGIVFLIIGAGFAYGAMKYEIGTPGAMGPGFFPFWTGIVLALLGITTFIFGFLESAEAQVIDLDLRRLLFIIGAVLVFALTVNVLGFPLALIAMTLIASRADKAVSFRFALITGLVLAVFGVAVFKYGLSVPLPLWPTIF